MFTEKICCIARKSENSSPKQFLLSSLKTYTLQYYGFEYIIFVRHKVIWRHPAAEHITGDLKNGSRPWI